MSERVEYTLRRDIEISPDDKRRYEAIESALDTLLTECVGVKDDWDDGYILAIETYHLGFIKHILEKREEAISCFTTALHLKDLPDPSAALEGRATCYLELGKPDEAIADCEEIRKIDKDSHFIPKCLSSAYIQKNEYAKAEVEVDRALKLYPKDPESLNAKGIALMHQKKFAAAKECFSKAIEQNPTFKPIQDNLRQVDLEIERHKLEQEEAEKEEKQLKGEK